MTTTQTRKWTRIQSDCMAAGWGRNIIYRSGDYTIVPDEPTGWILYDGGDALEFLHRFPTLREAKAYVVDLDLAPQPTPTGSSYRILINVQPDETHGRPGRDKDLYGYRPGDALVETYQSDCIITEDVPRALNRIFALHNRDDRPDGRSGPSLSVGDVVVLDDEWRAVEPHGFRVIDPAPESVVDGTWSEIMAAAR